MVLGLAAAILITPRAAYAQALLVSASPAPGAVLPAAPSEVRLVFNHPLLAQGTSITVSNAAGKRIDLGDGRIDPHNPDVLVVSLPLLFEGKFTVRYTASLLGSSVTLADQYEFTLDLPDPIVDLKSPANGQSFRSGAIPIRVQTRFVDFSAYNRRIRLYVDGKLQAELTNLRTTVTGLSPGVHQIRTVLVQLDEQEVPDTSTTVYVAIAQPDSNADEFPGERGRSDSVPEPTLSVIVGLILVSALMLGIGIWLGRTGE